MDEEVILESALVALSEDTYTHLEGCRIILYPDCETLSEVVESEGDKSAIREAASYGATVFSLSSPKDLLDFIAVLIENGAENPFTFENKPPQRDFHECWDEWEDED